MQELARFFPIIIRLLPPLTVESQGQAMIAASWLACHRGLHVAIAILPTAAA